MYKLTLKTVLLLVVATWISSTSCSRVADKSETFSVRITDKPLTFCNPINLNVGSERARRAGEPVVVLYKDDYYLFITGGRGYWYSGNMRDWTRVNAPTFPGGCPSVASEGKTLFASGDKGQHDVFSSADPKNGVPEIKIDLEHLAVTSCSFAGKIALITKSLFNFRPGPGLSETWI